MTTIPMIPKPQSLAGFLPMTPLMGQECSLRAHSDINT
jgi:hypothetical protein